MIRKAYNAVKVCLNEVYLEEEPRAAAYSGPGTPLMAFGEAALTDPDESEHYLPRRIRPRAWSNSTLSLYFSREKRGKQGLDENLEFDVVSIFSVSSKFPVGGVMQLNPTSCVCFFANFPSGTMAKFLKRRCLHELIVDPFNPLAIKMKILSKISEFPHGSRFGFNLTGGLTYVFVLLLLVARSKFHSILKIIRIK